MGPGCCGPLVFAVRRRNRLVHAEVYWSGRRVGLLKGVRVDQPYYRGEWVPATDSEFTAALLAQQWLPVLFRSPDGTTSAPARVLTRRTPGVAV